MRKIKKKTGSKVLKNIKYKTEKHIVCMNQAICRKVEQPTIACKECKFFKIIDVAIAEKPNVQQYDWWYL